MKELRSEVQRWKAALRQLYQDYKVCRQLKKRLKGGEKLTRAETRLVAVTSSSIRAVMPIVLLFQIPVGGWLVVLAPIKFPRLCPAALRSPKQAEVVRNEDIQRRRESYVDILDQLQQWAQRLGPPHKRILPVPLHTRLKDLDTTIEESFGGAPPSTDRLLHLRTLFVHTEDMSEAPRSIWAARPTGASKAPGGYDPSADFEGSGPLCSFDFEIDGQGPPRDYMMLLAKVWAPGWSRVARLLPVDVLGDIITRRVTHIAEDDQLLKAEGGARSLDDALVQEALLERGVLVAPGQDPRELLEKWVDVSTRNLTDPCPGTLVVCLAPLMQRYRQ